MKSKIHLHLFCNKRNRIDFSETTRNIIHVGIKEVSINLEKKIPYRIAYPRDCNIFIGSCVLNYIVFE